MNEFIEVVKPFFEYNTANILFWTVYGVVYLSVINEFSKEVSITPGDLNVPSWLVLLIFAGPVALAVFIALLMVFCVLTANVAFTKIKSRFGGKE